MLKIDMHSHIMPEVLPDFAAQFGYGDFIHLEEGGRPGYKRMMKGGTFFREVEANCYDAEKRLEDMARNNIDVQVMCTIPVLFNYWARGEDALKTSQYLNDHLADVVKQHPKRFVALGTLPMQSPELAVQELERCMNELGMAGIQIGSHINGPDNQHWNLSAPELFPVFEACERLGACVFVHAWDMMGAASMEDYWLPWLVGMPAETSRAICSMIFGGVLERLPKLRVAFCHGGGAFPGTIGRIEKGYHARPDLVQKDNKVNPRNYLGKFWVDSVVFDPAALSNIIELYGIDKVMLGSDYPFPLGELETGSLIDSMDFSEAERAQLLSRSALTWLGLDEKQFL